ncbi:ribosome assembly cofactor RimP [Formosa sp. A9]|uniref:ribosome assembly cofactor RimP n=1 Tax=Formosa sp. A9 TaxID=3442641 RepID=UPI003EBC08C2
MFRATVENLLDNALKERDDLFLINLTISADNAIKVIVDGDQGVNVDDCVFLSRAIEHNLDREEQDFSLEVMSAGAASPLTHTRQYVKNIGRTLEVKTSAETIEATLVGANDDEIVLEWKAREPKPVGKGKVTVQKKANIPYNDIVEAKVMIKF